LTEIFSILDQEQHPGGGSTRQAKDTIDDRISWRRPARQTVSYSEILFRLSILVLYLTGTANLSRNFFRLPDQSHRFPVQDADRQGDQADK
jgi:hypothetical protein